MKMPAFAVAAGLVVASLGFGAVAEAAPHHPSRHDDRREWHGHGHDRGRDRGWGRHDRRDDRRHYGSGHRYRAQYGHGYGRQRCRVEWHRGDRVRVCR